MTIETAAGTLLPGDRLRSTSATGCVVASITYRADGDVLVKFLEPWRIPLQLPAAMPVTIEHAGVAR